MDLTAPSHVAIQTMVSNVNTNVIAEKRTVTLNLDAGSIIRK